MASTLQDLLLATAMLELERQARTEQAFGPYVDADDPRDAILDGRFDLPALVAAVGRVALMDAADTVKQLRIGRARSVATPPEIAAHIRKDAADLGPDH